MNRQNILVLLGVLIVIGLAAIAYSLYQPKPDTDIEEDPAIANFDGCVAAGNPIMETYPRTCMANGVTFTEQVDTRIETNADGHLYYSENHAVRDLKFNNKSVNAWGMKVQSPLTITGEASGWYFEASFPVRLEDANGNVLAQGPAQAQGDWMTTDYVPFSVTLTYNTPSTETGKFILENDNPSGLPENAQKIEYTVTF